MPQGSSSPHRGRGEPAVWHSRMRPMPRRASGQPGWLAAHGPAEVVKQLDWIERLEEHRGVKVLPLGGEQIGVARDDNNGQVWFVLVRVPHKLPAVGRTDGNV